MQVIFVIQTNFWMTKRRIGCGVQSAFFLSESRRPTLSQVAPPRRKSDMVRYGVCKLLPFRATVLPILLTGNIVHDKHVHA